MSIGGAFPYTDSGDIKTGGRSMETPLRTLTKAISWQVLGLIGMVSLGYMMTGSFSIAGRLALFSMALGFAMFFIHERLWSKVRWGLRRSGSHT